MQRPQEAARQKVRMVRCRRAGRVGGRGMQALLRYAMPCQHRRELRRFALDAIDVAAACCRLRYATPCCSAAERHISPAAAIRFDTIALRRDTPLALILLRYAPRRFSPYAVCHDFIFYAMPCAVAAMLIRHAPDRLPLRATRLR